MVEWQDSMHSLNRQHLEYVCCRLLGRSGMSDEEFIQMCNDYLVEQQMNLEEFEELSIREQNTWIYETIECTVIPILEKVIEIIGDSE